MRPYDIEVIKIGRSIGVVTEKGRADEINTICEYVEKAVGNDSPILCFPETAYLFYFLTDRKSPVMCSYPDMCLLKKEWEKDFEDGVYKAQVCIVDSETSLEENLRPYGSVAIEFRDKIRRMINDIHQYQFSVGRFSVYRNMRA